MKIPELMVYNHDEYEMACMHELYSRVFLQHHVHFTFARDTITVSVQWRTVAAHG